MSSRLPGVVYFRSQRGQPATGGELGRADLAGQEDGKVVTRNGFKPEIGQDRAAVVQFHAVEPLEFNPVPVTPGAVEQFRKLFLRHTGATPKAYIQQLRLRKARALPQTNPQLTVKEAAEQTGFGDPHYLHAVFKQVYGIAPAACRRSPEGT